MQIKSTGRAVELRPWVVLWAGVLLWGAQGLGAQSASAVLGEITHVSRGWPDRPHVELGAASNPTNRDQLVVAAMVYEQSGTVAVPALYASRDGGITWRRTALPEQTVGIDPWVTFDAAGTAYFVHLPGRVWSSKDGGMHWGGGWRLEGGAAESLDFPKIVVGQGRRGLDNVLVVSGAADRDVGRLAVGPILVFRGSAADSSFALASRLLPANLNYQIAAPPVALPDDRLVVGFSEVSHDGVLLPPGRIWVTRSDLDSLVFDPPSLVPGDGGGYVSLAADGTGGPFHGRLYLSFVRLSDHDLLMSYSDDGGYSWSRPAPVLDEALAEVGTYPAMAVAEDGVLGLLFAGRGERVSEGCFEVLFAHSTDGGESFSSGRRISGTLSCPDTPGPNSFRVDEPEGRRVSDRFWAGGDYHGLTPQRERGFRAIWSDSRTGIFQLWTRTITPVR